MVDIVCKDIDQSPRGISLNLKYPQFSCLYRGMIIILFVRISILFFSISSLVILLREFPEILRFKVSGRLEISRFCLAIQKMGRKIF